jgi:hypothetical protein
MKVPEVDIKPPILHLHQISDKILHILDALHEARQRLKDE